MDIEKYEKKINDVILKAPIESGIQMIVYNLLDEIICKQGLSLLVVDKMQMTSRFRSLGGVPDLAIVSNDFKYHSPELGSCYGCIEVKATSIRIPNKLWQLAGLILTYKKVIYTNGIVWEYFDYEKAIQSKKYNIDKVDEVRNYLSLLQSEKIQEQEAKEIKKQIYDLYEKQECEVIFKPEWRITLHNDLLSDGCQIDVNIKEFLKLVTLLNNIEW